MLLANKELGHFCFLGNGHKVRGRQGREKRSKEEKDRNRKKEGKPRVHSLMQASSSLFYTFFFDIRLWRRKRKA